MTNPKRTDSNYSTGSGDGSITDERADAASAAEEPAHNNRTEPTVEDYIELIKKDPQQFFNLSTALKFNVFKKLKGGAQSAVIQLLPETPDIEWVKNRILQIFDEEINKQDAQKRNSLFLEMATNTAQKVKEEIELCYQSGIYNDMLNNIKNIIESSLKELKVFTEVTQSELLPLTICFLSYVLGVLQQQVDEGKLTQKWFALFLQSVAKAVVRQSSSLGEDGQIAMTFLTTVQAAIDPKIRVSDNIPHSSVRAMEAFRKKQQWIDQQEQQGDKESADVSKIKESITSIEQFFGLSAHLQGIIWPELESDQKSSLAEILRTDAPPGLFFECTAGLQLEAWSQLQDEKESSVLEVMKEQPQQFFALSPELQPAVWDRLEQKVKASILQVIEQYPAKFYELSPKLQSEQFFALSPQLQPVVTSTLLAKESSSSVGDSPVSDITEQAKKNLACKQIAQFRLGSHHKSKKDIFKALYKEINEDTNKQKSLQSILVDFLSETDGKDTQTQRKTLFKRFCPLLKPQESRSACLYADLYALATGHVLSDTERKKMVGGQFPQQGSGRQEEERLAPVKLETLQKFKLLKSQLKFKTPRLIPQWTQSYCMLKQKADVEHYTTKAIDALYAHGGKSFLYSEAAVLKKDAQSIVYQWIKGQLEQELYQDSGAQSGQVNDAAIQARFNQLSKDGSLMQRCYRAVIEALVKQQCDLGITVPSLIAHVSDSKLKKHLNHALEQVALDKLKQLHEQLRIACGKISTRGGAGGAAEQQDPRIARIQRILNQKPGATVASLGMRKMKEQWEKLQKAAQKHEGRVHDFFFHKEQYSTCKEIQSLCDCLVGCAKQKSIQGSIPYISDLEDMLTWACEPDRSWNQLPKVTNDHDASELQGHGNTSLASTASG